jgi:glucuronokinase
LIVGSAPARVGLLGNPSDGYGGRTLGLAVPRFQATVEVEPADHLEIVENGEDRPRWSSVADLVDRVDRHGYGTGPQLLAATVRTLADVATSVGHPGFDRLGCVVRYRTTIPRSVGLAGSSALVVAAIRALGEVTGLELPPEVLASVALRVETEQLGITAGLQDRVVQAMGGLVAMNFGEMEVDARFGVSHGEYRHLDPGPLPPLYVAYRERAAEPSDGYHRRLRQRFEDGDATVRETLHHLAGLAVEGEAALRWHDGERFAGLLAENMGLRRLLGPLPEAQVALVDAAERAGSPATFAGSGGAVVGAYTDSEHLDRIRAELEPLDARLVDLRPATDGEVDEDPSESSRTGGVHAVADGATGSVVTPLPFGSE